MRFTIKTLIWLTLAVAVVAYFYPRPSPQQDFTSLQVEAINAAIRNHHPKFQAGIPQTAGTEWDLDFMIGQQKSDFPAIFQTAELFDKKSAQTWIHQATSEQPTILDHAAKVIASHARYTGKVECYYMWSNIGKLYGNDGHWDEIWIILEDNMIVEWSKNPLTDY